MSPILMLVAFACTDVADPSDSEDRPADTDEADTDPVDTDTDAVDTDTASPDTDPDTEPPPTDDDGDGFVEPDDCDDADATVFPGAPEVFDLRDDDCDGEGDVLDTSAAQSVTGLRRAPGSGDQALGAGDVDGDGVVELAVAEVNNEESTGTIWVLSAASFTGADVADVEEAVVASVSASTGSFALSVVPPKMRNVTGGNEASLVVGGPDYEGGIAFAVFEAPAGDLTLADARLTATGHECGANDSTELALVDMTGDGIAEIIYGCGSGRTTAFDPYGSTGMLDAADADLTLLGTAPWDSIGLAADGADVDGDGDEELVIASPASTWSAPDGGAIYVIDGGPLTGASVQADTIATTRFEGTASGGFLGHRGLVVTDIDADGTHEVVSQYVSGGYLFAWELDGTPGAFTTSDARFTLNRDWAFTGSFAAGGDIDGDGFTDLAIATDASEILLFSGADLGTGTYELTDAAARLTSTAPVFGWAMLLPDLDGDGKADVIAQSADGIDATLWWFDS